MWHTISTTLHWEKCVWKPFFFLEKSPVHPLPTRYYARHICLEHSTINDNAIPSAVNAAIIPPLQWGLQLPALLGPAHPHWSCHHHPSPACHCFIILSSSPTIVAISVTFASCSCRCLPSIGQCIVGRKMAMAFLFLGCCRSCPPPHVALYCQDKQVVFLVLLALLFLFIYIFGRGHFKRYTIWVTIEGPNYY